MKPLDVLRYHVTGAIERGERRPIVAIDESDARYLRRQTLEHIARELEHAASKQEPASWVAALLADVARRLPNNEAPLAHAEHCLAEWQAAQAGRAFDVFPRGWQPMTPRPFATSPEDE